MHDRIAERRVERLERQLREQRGETMGEIPREGDLCLQGWDGFSRQRVRIVGETPQRYRIEALTVTHLAGRSRRIQPGETALVPKYAVREPKP